MTRSRPPSAPTNWCGFGRPRSASGPPRPCGMLSSPLQRCLVYRIPTPSSAPSRMGSPPNCSGMPAGMPRENSVWIVLARPWKNRMWRSARITASCGLKTPNGFWNRRVWRTSRYPRATLKCLRVGMLPSSSVVSINTAKVMSLKIQCGPRQTDPLVTTGVSRPVTPQAATG